MNFKRTTNSTQNLEDFIDGAETQKELIKGNDKTTVSVKISKELGEKIRKKYPIINLHSFIKQALIEEIQYIKEETLPFIYQKSKWHNMDMINFVKFKMGLMEAPLTSNLNNEKEKVRYIGIKTNIEEREKIKKNAQNLGLSLGFYSEIKILATYELKNVFTFDELMQFKAEAMNYELELDEYIAMRIKG